MVCLLFVCACLASASCGGEGCDPFGVYLVDIDWITDEGCGVPDPPEQMFTISRDEKGKLDVQAETGGFGRGDISGCSLSFTYVDGIVSNDFIYGMNIDIDDAGTLLGSGVMRREQECFQPFQMTGHRISP